MFIIGFFESFQWPLGIPKATHGILKGFCLLMIGILFFHQFVKKKIFKESKEKNKQVVLKILMLLFLLSYTVSALFSVAPGAAILNLWYPLIATVAIFGISELKFSKIHFNILLLISVFLIFSTFIFAFFSLMFRYSVDNIYYFLFLEHRANALLSELRTAGKYVALGPYFLLFPFSLTFLLDKTKSLSRTLLGLSIYAVVALTAVISNNRIDVLVLAIQSVSILFLIPRKIAIIALICLIPITQFGLYTTEKYFGFSLVERIFRPKVERDLETIDIRFTYWQTAINNFKYYPLFGTGPNSYNEISEFPVRRYYLANVGDKGGFTVKEDEGIGIHNVFFERLSDTGLFGLLTFLALLFYFFRKDALQVLRLSDTYQRNKYILLALSSWSWIMYGITDNGFGAQGYVTFFFLRAFIEQL